jgi:hypothetical protein
METQRPRLGQSATAYLMVVDGLTVIKGGKDDAGRAAGYRSISNRPQA